MNPETVRAPEETEAAQIMSTTDEPTEGSELPKVTDASGSFNPEALQEATGSIASVPSFHAEEPHLLVQPLQSISPVDVIHGPEANPTQLPKEGDVSQGPKADLVQLPKEGTKMKSKK